MTDSGVRFTTNVRTMLCVMALAAFGATGCGDDAPDVPGVATPVNQANAELEAYRCRISPAAWSGADEPTENPWLSRGPNGPMMFARRATARTLGWSDGRRGGSLVDGERLRPDALAWTGRRLLALSDTQLESFSASLEDRRVQRAALPSGAMEVTLVEIPGRAAIVGHRVTRGLTLGTAFVQFVGADGEAMGPLRLLSTDTGFLVNTVRARWDFGRLVVTSSDTDGNDAYWVLDPTGNVLNTGRLGSTLACPRGGCLRVVAAQQGMTDTDNPGENHEFLRVEALDGNTRFDTNTEAGSLRTVAVSGDRVLVMMTPSNEAPGCTVRVIDVSRREVVGDGSEFHDDGLTCEMYRVRPIAKGFALAVTGSPGADSGHSVGVRTIECGR